MDTPRLFLITDLLETQASSCVSSSLPKPNHHALDLTGTTFHVFLISDPSPDPTQFRSSWATPTASQLLVCLSSHLLSPIPSKVKVKSLSRVWLFATTWTVAYRAPPSMGFSRQESWSGLPLPSPGDLPSSGIKPGSTTLQADTLPSEPPSLSLLKATVKESFPRSHLSWLQFSQPRLSMTIFCLLDKEQMPCLTFKVLKLSLRAGWMTWPSPVEWLSQDGSQD